MDSIFFIVVVVVILVPIFQRVTLKLTIPPQFESCHFQEIPSQQQTYFAETQEALEAEGFTCIGYYTRVVNKRATIYIALLTHHNHRDRATINYLTYLRWVELYAEFTKKESIETTNSLHADIVHNVSEKRNFPFPQIQDIHYLYQLHCSLLTRYVGDAEPVFLEEGHELERLTQSIVSDLKRLADAHHMYFDQASHSYRPTWKGAILSTLRNLFPIRQILVRRKAARVLKQLGMS